MMVIRMKYDVFVNQSANHKLIWLQAEAFLR